MKKLLSWGTCFFLLSGMTAISASADEVVEELLMAEGLNCPCKAEVVAPPPPPPPASPVKYYGGLELFGLSKSLLEGGHNVISDGSDNGGPFGTNETLIHVDDATEHFDFGGGRLTVGRVLNDRDAIEFTMMGFSHESSDSIIDDSDDINAVWEDTAGGFLPGGIFNDNFDRADAQWIDSGTRMVSLEANYRRQLTQIFSAFVGIRYAYLGDDLLLTTDDSGCCNPDGYYDIDGNNHMFGPQVGVDMNLLLTNRLGLNTGVKIGGFMNIAQIDTIIAEVGAERLQFKDDDVRGSLISEGNIAMSWKFTDNMSASLGYMAMLMSFVTTAGENFAQANTAAEFQKHDSDHILVHGPLARINLTFD